MDDALEGSRGRGIARESRHYRKRLGQHSRVRDGAVRGAFKQDQANQVYGQYTIGNLRVEAEYRRWWRDRQIFNGLAGSDGNRSTRHEIFREAFLILSNIGEAGALGNGSPGQPWGILPLFPSASEASGSRCGRRARPASRNR